MKNLVYGLLILLCVVPVSVFGQNDQNITGNWEGSLDLNGKKIRLILKVEKNSDGSLTAKLDSPDQGATDLPIDTIMQKEKAVSFSGANLGLNYEGTLNEKMDEITGALKQGAASFPLALRRTGEIVKPKRPQMPQKPYPYKEEEVSYRNAKDNVKLAGTLTVPRGEGEQHPAVILITGSGSQDRDETAFGHKPFLVLADYLTRKGIAVLRVDDRGMGGSEIGSYSVTSENFAGDVLAGIEFLKTRREIDARKIGLVGHSEGGMIAPMVAVRSKDVAFIVLLAGLGQTGADTIVTQIELINKAAGVSEEVRAQTVELQKKINHILKTEPDNKIADRKIRDAIDRQTAAMNVEQKKAFAEAKATMENFIPAALTQWFRYFVAYDPRPTLEKVKVPVLALNGENDLQVAWKENLDLIAAGLKAGGNKDVTVKSFPKLNHLFQTSITGALGEYEQIEETISPVVLETVADWILKRTAGK